MLMYVKKIILDRNLLPSFSTFQGKQNQQNKTPLVSMKVVISQETYNYSFPLFSKLAKNLELVGTPLGFDCGYACSCGTCAVTLDQATFQIMKQTQPPSDEEKKVLRQNGFEDNLRLSCQLFVIEEMKDSIIFVE